ncbi:Y4bD/Y4pK family protein [Paraburkholderia sediminicola]|uniref:Y4bD/Y4pK family protein n=1 Tax=Paraburkholderia sediminicola TaxID=458836 RepID=UPI0038B78FF6
MPNPDLGWAEICHPFHPLKGQRFPVLKTRRVGGVDTLLVGHAERSSFSIAREWTDWGTPTVHSGDVTVCCFELDMLLELIDLIDQLALSASKKSSAKGA